MRLRPRKEFLPLLRSESQSHGHHEMSNQCAIILHSSKKGAGGWMWGWIETKGSFRACCAQSKNNKSVVAWHGKTFRPTHLNNLPLKFFATKLLINSFIIDIFYWHLWMAFIILLIQYKYINYYHPTWSELTKSCIPSTHGWSWVSRLELK